MAGRRFLLAVVMALAPCLALAQPGPFATFDAAGPAVLSDPHDVAVGPDGRLYVADKFANRIAVMDPETLDVVGEIAPGALPNVHDVAFGPDGRAVVAVTGLSAALVFDDLASGEPVLSLPASRTEGAMIHSNGQVYVTAGGTGEVIAYDGADPVARAGGHFGAHDIAEAPDGTVWVADNFNRRLVQYSPALEQLQIISSGLVGARYLDVDEAGRLIVADQDAHRILMIDPLALPGAQLVGVIGDGVPGVGPGKFDDPEGVAVDGTRYFIADSDNNRIVRYIVVLN